MDLALFLLAHDFEPDPETRCDSLRSPLITRGPSEQGPPCITLCGFDELGSPFAMRVKPTLMMFVASRTNMTDI